MIGREKLAQLEASGAHVFHGSPEGNLEALEPRQGRHVPDLAKPEEDIPDGDPAVSATPHADLATFRAVINGKNVPFPHTSGFGTDGAGAKQFRVSSARVLDEAAGKKGFVYVFDRKDFVPYSRDGEATERSMEWRAAQTVKPLEVVEVTHEDLPPREQIEVGEGE